MNVENLKVILTAFWFAAKADWEKKNQRAMNTDVRQAIKHMKVTKDQGVVYNLLLLHRDLGLENILDEESVVAKPEGEPTAKDVALAGNDGKESAALQFENLAPATEPEIGQGVKQVVELTGDDLPDSLPLKEEEVINEDLPESPDDQGEDTKDLIDEEEVLP